MVRRGEMGDSFDGFDPKDGGRVFIHKVHSQLADHPWKWLVHHGSRGGGRRGPEGGGDTPVEAARKAEEAFFAQREAVLGDHK